MDTLAPSVAELKWKVSWCHICCKRERHISFATLIYKPSISVAIIASLCLLIGKEGWEGTEKAQFLCLLIGQKHDQREGTIFLFSCHCRETWPTWPRETWPCFFTATTKQENCHQVTCYSVLTTTTTKKKSIPGQKSYQLINTRESSQNEALCQVPWVAVWTDIQIWYITVCWSKSVCSWYIVYTYCNNISPLENIANSEKSINQG